MCKFIVVTNRTLCRGDFLEQIHAICLAGADKIILREKDLSEESYEELAEKVCSVCGNYNTELVLHQNISVSRRLGVKKIHLSVPALVEHFRELEGFEQIGVSVHSRQQLETAKKCGASYVFYGHVFQTDCKKGVPPRGSMALHEICEQAEVPVYAIGGISPENAAEALKAGADGVCVMSWGMQQSEAAMREFIERIQCRKLYR